MAPKENPYHLFRLPDEALAMVAMDSAFDVLAVMAVNVLAERGADGVLRAMAGAAGGLSDPARAALAKALGRPEDALPLLVDLVGRGQCIEDAVVAAKMWHAPLHARMVEAMAGTRDFMDGVASHAFMHKEAQEVGGEGLAARLGAASMPLGGGGDGSGVRIVGITKVRDEGRLLRLCASNMALFCDAVVVYDDNSSDGSVDALAAAWPEDGFLTVLRDPGTFRFHNKAVYDLLFEEARRLGATHVVMLDADEIACGALLDREAVRRMASAMRPGESLAVRWEQYAHDGFLDHRRFYRHSGLGRLLQPYKDFMYCDDGAATHLDVSMHNSWMPGGFPVRRHFLHDVGHGLLHFDRANRDKALHKIDAYLLRELVEHGHPLEGVLNRYLPRTFVGMFSDGKTVPARDLVAAAPLIPGMEAYREFRPRRVRESAELAARLPESLSCLLCFEHPL